MDKIDAIVVPQGWRGFQDEAAMYHEIMREFGQALGVDTTDPNSRLYMSEIVTEPGKKFIRADVHQKVRFDKQHPKYASQQRYKWTLADDGMALGVLTDQAREDMKAAP